MRVTNIAKTETQHEQAGMEMPFQFLQLDGTLAAEFTLDHVKHDRQHQRNGKQGGPFPDAGNDGINAVTQF